MTIHQKIASMSFDAVFLLLFALNLVLAAPFFVVDPSREWVLFFLLWCVIPSLSSLLAIWMSLSGRGRPWRIVAGFLALFGFAWGAAVAQLDIPEGFFHITFWVMLFVMVPLMVVRLFRWCILKNDITELPSSAVEMTHSDTLTENETTIASEPRFQFTLATMFGWTTALAVVLGVLQGMPMIASNRHIARDEVFGLFAITLMVPFIVLSALGTQSVKTRGMALVFVVYTPMCLTCCVSIVFVPATLLIYAQLLLVRKAGYRLVRVSPGLSQENPPRPWNSARE